VDVSKAFGTIQNLDKTIGLLKNSALEIPWLNPFVQAPYTDLLHIAASWVWAAGGDLVNGAGTQVVFDSPQALEGLTLWLNTYRAVAQAHKTLVPEDCSSLFEQGRAAATLLDVHRANTLLDGATNPLVRENLGMASLTDVPWVGGGNFVIWEHVRGQRERENAAVELVKFLTSKDANLRWKQECGHMPARLDAQAEVYPSGNPLHGAMELAARQGRAYYNIPLWRRIEYQLSQALGAVVKEAYDNPSAASQSILRAQLEPLARRLNLTLSN
jgi:multiple sugar transport system substrate-binding protein